VLAWGERKRYVNANVIVDLRWELLAVATFVAPCGIVSP